VTTVDADDSALLSTLLDSELAFDATTSDRLSNHLPMALLALHRLGGSDERLAEFAAGYRRRLAPLDVADALDGFDAWRSARGQHGAYAPARGYLEACVARDGIDATVRRHVPQLIDGLSGAAFHGIIRLAYALESGRGPRVAAGLAYLTEVHQPLGARDREAAVTDDPLAALEQLSGLGDLRVAAGAGNIGQRMRAVGAHPGFAGVVDWLEIDDATPARLVAAATALYAATDDFTALHGLTASHAVGVVAPYAEDRTALTAWWFQALAAAYVTIGAPPLGDPAAPLAPWIAAPLAWEAIAAAAATSDDEHVIKLVYSARALDGARPDPLLRAAAARQAGVNPADATATSPEETG
jgi:hypothetical protein